MDRLFHGCAYANFDGTRKLIAKSHDCIVRTWSYISMVCTNKCFEKNASDVATSIKTRSMTKNECAAPLKTINDYFKDKEKDNDII